jgi:hypothetical protein
VEATVSDAILWTSETGQPARQIGKLVGGVYVYDSPVVFRRIQALGISLTVLTHMLNVNATRIDYIVDGDTYSIALGDVWRKSFTDNGGRRGYVYVRLKDWNRQPGRRNYAWVPAAQLVNLPWMIDAPLVNMRRADAREAAKPAAVQMAMAMGA